VILSFFFFFSSSSSSSFFASEISKSFGFYEVSIHPSSFGSLLENLPLCYLLLLLLLLPTLHTNGTGLVWFLYIYLFACLLALSVGR